MSKHSGTSKFALLVLLWLSTMKKQSVFSDRRNPWLLDAGRIVDVGESAERGHPTLINKDNVPFVIRSLVIPGHVWTTCRDALRFLCLFVFFVAGKTRAARGLFFSHKETQEDTKKYEEHAGRLCNDSAKAVPNGRATHHRFTPSGRRTKSNQTVGDGWHDLRLIRSRHNSCCSLRMQRQRVASGFSLGIE